MDGLPPGTYDRLVTRSVSELLAQLPESLIHCEEVLGNEDIVEYLVREIAERTKRLLDDLSRAERADVLEQANTLLTSLRSGDEAQSRVLKAVYSKVEQPPSTPVIPLSRSALVTNEQGLNYHQVLRSELLCADRVDLICPFIGNQGLNLVLDLLQRFGPNLRVITTTYLGGTHVRALERLAERKAQIKIVYERPSEKTALHAKAWIFHRDSGYSTATIGSSNLSPKALVDGLEWNVRLSHIDAPQILHELAVTFERLWSDPQYEMFDASRDSERLRKELAAQRQTDSQHDQFFAEIVPRPHQVEALDALAYARMDGKHQNLVVAATGTGKTLLSAFDYERLTKEWGGVPTLLFVAHREDILRQSVGAFQAVMRDSDFGELNVGEFKADGWQYVFASVQSLAGRNLQEFEPHRFDVLIIDEFHHAEAPTYARLLDHFKPRELLGLTATPERADGRRGIIERLWPPTYELRLWHALERQLLCPFHYFGVDDGTDLASLSWSRGRYDDADLEEEYVTRGEERAMVVIRELATRTDHDDLRAVAFCATVRHADFMAECFKKAGYDAHPLHSQLPADIRHDRVKKFRKGEHQILCTVDLFNEGVDIPEINTVLFLRPTESATIFIQQLGRGLRNHRDKGALTVLDFVGQQNQKFRMDLRFRALTGLARVDLAGAVKSGFPRLPPGCDIRLDRLTEQRVLQNLRDAIPSDIRALADEARRLSVDGTMPSLAEFLQLTNLEPEELYRSGRSYAKVLHVAGLRSGEVPSRQDRLGAVVHADDRHRLSAYLDVVREDRTSEFSRMLRCQVGGQLSFDFSPEMRPELVELLEVLRDKSPNLSEIAPDLPFRLHARYRRDEIVAPYRDNPTSMRQGTFYVAELQLDVHLVTLRKSEREFSSTTRYDDYFLSPKELHWESQSTTSIGSETGRRYVSGSSRQLFFVRENREDAFLCLGFGHYVSHKSERPIQIRFDLEHLVPDHIYIHFERASG